MKTNCGDKLSEVVEINLLYAQREMDLAVFDRSALVRARQHLEHALKAIRAEKSGKLKIVKNDAA
ncbi:hypothetical protein M2323_003985 [Rhodoblastus acidophilus]|uniref:hypothetical protein n=1 Tax=Rhodoblastus acidophilus TaxID=1074 RepID=UPI0022249512|nr:hypothetical protein [Rhodoblastus acidophilus]MCW2286147.1 hypothetical protein [Rhodoblastus acidophilus]MCW2335041.1 hypothetical protein [Rhodoblastus acidophilus]